MGKKRDDDYEDDEFEEEEDEHLTPLGEAAVYMHEMFLALVEAGFNENQAITLVARMNTEDAE